MTPSGTHVRPSRATPWGGAVPRAWSGRTPPTDLLARPLPEAGTPATPPELPGLTSRRSPLLGVGLVVWP